MISLLVSLLVSASPAASAAAASVTCPDDPASCDAAWVDLAGPVEEGPREYATPAEVDCPAPSVADVPGGPAAPAEIGECDAPPDLWYRASRLADGPLRKDGGLLPAKHRRDTRTASSFDPPREPAQLSAPDLQPLALFALPSLSPLAGPAEIAASEEKLPRRALAPPDRPPRA